MTLKSMTAAVLLMAAVSAIAPPVASAAAQHTGAPSHEVIRVASPQEIAKRVCSLKPQRYIISFVKPGTKEAAYERRQVQIVAHNLDATVFEVDVTGKQGGQLDLQPAAVVVAIAWSLDKKLVEGMSMTSHFLAGMDYPASWTKITRDMLDVVEGAGRSVGQGYLGDGVPCEQLQSF